MAPFSGIGELYLICAGIGSLYLIISLLLGQINGHHIQHLGHATGTHSGGTNCCHGANGQLTSHQAVHHLHTSAHGAHFANNGSNQIGISNHNSTGTQTYPVPALSARLSMAGQLLITIFNPMSLAVFLAFFGIAGNLIYSHLPYLGILTLVPALIIGLLFRQFILTAMNILLTRLDSKNVAGVNELIGHMAKVTIGIGQGGVWQISYVLQGTRKRSSAKAAASGQEFPKGARVMIVDFADQVAYVEPWTDSFIPEEDAIDLTGQSNPIKEP